MANPAQIIVAAKTTVNIVFLYGGGLDGSIVTPLLHMRASQTIYCSKKVLISAFLAAVKRLKYLR